MFSLCFSLLSHLNSALQMHSPQHYSSDLSFVPSHLTWQPAAFTWTPPPHSHRNPPFPPQPTHRSPAAFFLVILWFFSQPSWPSHGWWVTSHLSFSTPFLIDPHVSPGSLLGFLAGDFCSYFFLHFGVASIFAFFCVPSALATHHALPALILSALLSFMCQRMAFPSLEMSFKSTLPLHQRLKKRWAGLTGRIWKICLLSWWKWLALVTNV